MTAPAERAAAWIDDHVTPGNLDSPAADGIKPAPRWLELPDDPPELRRELRARAEQENP